MENQLELVWKWKHSKLSREHENRIDSADLDSFAHKIFHNN